MAKDYQIIRLAVIINKLNTRKYIPTAELVDEVNGAMRLRGCKDCSLRTIQRDINAIADLFGIEIGNDKSRGYYIAERHENADRYEDLLLNFELLSSIDADSTLQKYVVAEHHAYKVNGDFHLMLEAIRRCLTIEFDYCLVRQGGKIVHFRLKPHFLKESQQRWYLIGYIDNDKNDLRTLGIDRISNVSVAESAPFKRNDSVDIRRLFEECYGIWNNLSDPVEDIELKYDALDGAFIKTLPLHQTQVVTEGEDGITVRLRLRVTNDFVMALLSRSRSVTVVKPDSLRERLCGVWKAALERNGHLLTDKTEPL